MVIQELILKNIGNVNNGNLASQAAKFFGENQQEFLNSQEIDPAEVTIRWAFIVALSVVLVIQIVLYIVFYRKTKKMKEVRWMVHTIIILGIVKGFALIGQRVYEIENLGYGVFLNPGWIIRNIGYLFLIVLPLVISWRFWMRFFHVQI